MKCVCTNFFLSFFFLDDLDSLSCCNGLAVGFVGDVSVC